MPWTDPWFWAFLAALRWGSGCGAFFADPPGSRLEVGIAGFVVIQAPQISFNRSAFSKRAFVIQPRFDAYSSVIIGKRLVPIGVARCNQ